MLKFSELYLPYWYLAIIRVILVLIPQLGYIHPDEYFQSIEILAGKIFNVECKQPWEFNITFPVRSIAIPYFTIGFSYNILKILNYFFNQIVEIKLITPYLLIVFPRLLMCSLSFLIDFSLYKICINNNEKYKSKLLVLASSYVMIVYGTHTFSNTLELVLFAVLLYYVAESLTFSNIILKEREYLNLRYKKSKNPVDKAKFHKLRLFLTTDSLRNVIEISTLTVLGFFNRPTFLAFAVAPVFFWLYRGIGCKSVTSLQFHLRMLIFLICSVPTTVFIITVDSFYYGYISWGEIGMLDISINNFVFTPLNFVKYNMNTKHLAQHGLHSRFLHLLVNIPLLFNILGLFGIIGIINILYRLLRKKFHLLPTIRSIKGLMTLSMVTPVAVLSIFPHQEPRFLIPILVPLVYLHGTSIYSELDKTVIKATKVSACKKTDLEIRTKKISYNLLKLWFFINIMLILFYGFIHQGGVYPVTSHLSAEMKTESSLSTYHIFTSHIYSIPESFFLQLPTNKLHFSNNKKYQVKKKVVLYEEGSNNLNSLLNKILTVLTLNKKQNINGLNDKIKLYLIIPGSLRENVNLINYNITNLTLIEKNIFYPHLSTEALPDNLLLLFQHFLNSDVGIFDFIVTLTNSCSLILYQIFLN